MTGICCSCGKKIEEPQGKKKRCVVCRMSAINENKKKYMLSNKGKEATERANKSEAHKRAIKKYYETHRKECIYRANHNKNSKERRKRYKLKNRDKINAYRRNYNFVRENPFYAIEGLVYFCLEDEHRGDGQRIKIGFTITSKELRLAHLQSASPSKLVFIGLVPGQRYDEKLAHLRLEKYNHHGEWFYYTKEVADVISNWINSNRIEEIP